MARRTQSERSEQTTTALIQAGATLFGQHGYARTSMAAVAAEAGMTTGAAYHHFDNKVSLFRAVFVRQEQELAAALADDARQAPDTWTALRDGCHAFLRRCLDQNLRQIVLRDGPAALGWDTVREIEYHYTLRLLQHGLTAAAADGWIISGDQTIRGQILFGALCEAGMLLARSDDPDATLSAVITETDHFLNALALSRPTPEPA